MTKVFMLAKSGVEHLPEPVARGLFTAVADVVWLTRTGGLAQLERNLARVRPDLDRRGLRQLSRAGIRAYLRYYCEAFQLPRLSADQLRARVRATGDGPLRETFADGGSVVAALGHNGNWDLAGAWATKELAPVVTVAEHLEPEELFQDFLDFRTSLGMTIIPMDRGSGVFRQLIRHTRGSASIVPLLADRDLSASGVEVDLFGHRARVAAGPAALSLATGAPLHATMIRHERLTGARRRAAGSRWGIVIEFSERLDVAGETPDGEPLDVATLTQRWVDALGAGIARHPADWHMLQKVFLDDLDAGRLAAPSASAHEAR
ncbi:phosphatidylinositol mannoside acyltransferase [Georgenia subflava]|uniref:Phosphatidylinositol mannoside acyltransferase n=1 Tax=Georgenia subflava TaxID=1622177 RepID=A0A6N7EMK0_9MICO|nr:phosphatidylinositol mannoside acyltransferase [Georgenia subflava]MPV37745.1 phosphatidylinositol mannoside acyltransferase [Georgenia subflava]